MRLGEVGMVEARSDPRLVDQHRDELLVPRVRSPESLGDGELAEPRSTRTRERGEVNLRHSAFTELGNQLVLPEDRSHQPSITRGPLQATPQTHSVTRTR